MRKFFAILLSLSLFTGCAARHIGSRAEETRDNTSEAQETEQAAAEVRETEEVTAEVGSAEEESAEVGETEEETAEDSLAQGEATAETSDSYDTEFGEELGNTLLAYFENMDMVCFEYTKDGEFIPADTEEYALRSNLYMMEQYLSRDIYDELIEAMDGDTAGMPDTYEEYRDFMLELYSDYSDSIQQPLEEYFDDEGNCIYDAEPAVLCLVSFADSSDEETFPIRKLNTMLLDYLTDLPEKNGEIKDMIGAARDSGDDVYIELGCHYLGKGELRISVVAACYGLQLDSYFSETLTAQPEGGFYLNGVLVPSDTEKLFISSREEYVAEMLAGEFLPEDCLWICQEDSYGAEPVFDMKQIAEGLPELRELYMYQAQAENTEAIADMQGLEVLSYYVSTDSEYPSETLNDLPFTELRNLKKLRIYGEYEDYSFLHGMDGLDEVFVEIMTDSKGMESLFEQTCVTGVEITVIGSDGYGDLSGISNMKNLTELTVEGGNIDYDAIGELSRLKKLYIRAYNKADTSALAKLDELEDITLMDVETDDWSFLADMEKLTTLTLSYTNTEDEDIEMLDDLISLSMTETSNTYSVIGELDSLETVFVMDISGSIDDFDGSDTLRSYGEMMGDGGDYSALLNCPKLTHITLLGCNGRFSAADFADSGLEELFCNGTTVEEPLALGDIPTLKIVELSYDDADLSLQEQLRQLLPDCKITVDNMPFFHN